MMLNKPVRQSSLYDAIITVQNQVDVQPLQIETVKPETGKLLGRVLFVDDNLINHYVGEEMLSVLGLDFEIATNGHEALAARKNGSFDLILMDCQMPIMDGFEATRQIRKFEGGESSERITIIALTANAMQGDRDRCLQAGMDDYLAKPYNLESLFGKLSRWLPSPDDASQSVSQSAEVIVPEKDTQSKLIDIAKFKETKQMMAKKMPIVVSAFFDSGRENVALMKQGLLDENPQVVGSASHALKGNSAIVGAQQLYATCDKLELLCREGEVVQLGGFVSEISEIFEQSMVEIEHQMDTKI
jgi:CheY-like chemotaxis protein/HPt (histidine-containing phosphotransfer) domain-containing protein